MKSFTTTASAAVRRIDTTDKPENIPSLTHRYLNGSLTYNAQDLSIIEIRNVLITWYSKNRRKLPWRGDLDDEGSNNELHLETIVQKQYRKSRVSAYGTWVSEIMCQQTKVETVINYWKRWMTEYPTVEDLAAASPDDVNKLWAGLGYYRRAQQLLLGAKKVVAEFGGNVPSEKAALLRIPGIGPYTAGAISSIAFHAAEPVVDGNVVRVLSRLYAIDPAVNLTQLVGAEAEAESEDDDDEIDGVDERESSRGGKTATPLSAAQNKKTTSKKNVVEKLCWVIAAELVHPEEPGDFNQALMELGATVCKPTSPDCVSCPIRDMCRANKLALASATLTSSAAAKVEQDEEGAKKNKKARVQTTLNKFFVSKPTSVITQDKCEQEKKTEAVVDLTFSDVVLERCHLLPKDVTYFPIKQAKKAPREVAVAVYVLALTCSDASRRYLFLRRPPTGLLANQWEFPSIVMESTDSNANLTSADNNVMAQLKSYLRTKIGSEILLTGDDKGLVDDGDMGREEGKGRVAVVAVRNSVPCVEPSILHIFSHERHNMAVSIWEVDLLDPTTTQKHSQVELLAPSSQPNLWIWMTAEEIRKAGITTGCKKILVAAESSFRQQFQSQSSSGTTDTNSPALNVSKKRVANKKSNER